MSQNRSPGPEKVIPEERAELFSDPPLLPDEDPSAYDKVVAELVLLANPHDYIDWVYVRDAADELWNAQRLRRIKASVITVAHAGALENHLYVMLKREGEAKSPEAADDLEQRNTAQRLTWGWLSLEGGELEKRVNGMLRAGNINLKLLSAQGVADRIGVIETFDKLIAASDKRRDAALHAIEARRAVRDSRSSMARDFQEAAE